MRRSRVRASCIFRMKIPAAELYELTQDTSRAGQGFRHNEVLEPCKGRGAEKPS